MPRVALKMKGHRVNLMSREDAGVRSNRKRAPRIPALPGEAWPRSTAIGQRRGLHRSR